MKTLLLPALSLALCGAALAQPPEGYYRFPALHGNTLVFTAEGDLWTVGIEGGPARRLTTHAGEETDPKISPDGRTVAFSASYEGPVELYTMPLEGGLPTRRTFEAQASIPVGWTPQGDLIYATQEYSTLPEPRLAVLDLASGRRRWIPLTPASDGSYDSGGTTLYFARPGFHRNNTKRYQGGTARNIWKFSEGDAEAVNLTGDFPGENHSPMAWNGRVYYVCDRDGTMNIWSMDAGGKNLRQHTRHSGWDVQSPSLSQGKIAYQLGADLWVLDIASGTDRRVPVRLASDFDQLRENWVDRPMEYLTSAHLHPSGESVVLTARGRVFVAPVRKGRLVRASVREGVRYRETVFMPDGQSLLVLSDESGELEFWTLPANGAGDGRALTRDGRILRFQGFPSPDSRWIAYSDKNEDLWVLNLETGRQILVSTNREGIGDMAWSPDSRWLAYTMTSLNTYQQIHLYGVEEGQRAVMTGDRTNSLSPAWSPDGRFLYFLSDRSLNTVVSAPWGPRQPEPYFDRSFKIYHVALRAGLRSPFSPDDELSPKPEAAEKNTQASARTQIEFEGLQARLKEVPVRAGNYSRLSATDKALFWLERDAGLDARTSLAGIKIENLNPKPVKILDDVRTYELSADGKKAMLRKGSDLYVIDAEPKAATGLEEHKLDLSGWSFSINVRDDLRQLFIDAWRLERDYFYDPGMHGLDWSAMRDKYLPLADRVTTRAELNDLIGQLVGELSALHVSVRGGDQRRGDDRIQVATLGAQLEPDEAAGGYRISYIYQSDPDYPDQLSPLADPELNIRPGDILEAVNGVGVFNVAHPHALLRNQQGRQVLLQVKSGTDGTSRRVIVKPIANEADLRYRDWEYSRRLRVEKDGHGEIGYVHLRAMGGEDLEEWYRSFYPVFNRKGLIVDVRNNRGGNIDSILLEKLMRKAWFYWKPRVGEPYWNMQYAFRGHMVLLCNENTASDGEAFAEGFRRLGLGKVIGTRTWGGEIWLSNNNPLTDGGLARAPQNGVYGPEGVWLIEGHGVDPDIVVDNLPHATFNGEDAQLKAAIDYLLEAIRKNPVAVPPAPPYPDKSFKYPKRQPGENRD